MCSPQKNPWVWMAVSAIAAALCAIANLSAVLLMKQSNDMMYENDQPRLFVESVGSQYSNIGTAAEEWLLNVAVLNTGKKAAVNVRILITKDYFSNSSVTIAPSDLIPCEIRGQGKIISHDIVSKQEALRYMGGNRTMYLHVHMWYSDESGNEYFKVDHSVCNYEEGKYLRWCPFYSPGPDQTS